MAVLKITLLIVCCVAAASAYGTSKTSVSKPHQGKFDYGIDHSKHGSWHGSAHPHGYGGLGDGHGSYGLGGAHVIGILPQGGYGGAHGGSYGPDHGHGHAISSANFNLKAISHGHY
ncbi:Hypothetical protein NTJ_05913 [Nesidiocoris tenuis]|uniref:DUF4766 domain-containing protein n=1 Tax=Nesidiocoris tenuis TaxID=355587 RepID=A0ABN7APA4_9HEMI|nr:Hypothetical protein NTJ_05913 [Nesidiocoris tenuis]